MPDNRRRSPRRRHLRRGSMVFKNGRGMMGCVILDLHEGGAKLKVADWMGIPDRIELRIENGPTHQAEIRYRTMEILGVQFNGDKAN